MNEKAHGLYRALEIMTHFHINQKTLSDITGISYQVIKNSFCNPDLMSVKRWKLIEAKLINHICANYSEDSKRKVLKINTGVINDD